ncbi:formin BNI1-like isoform X1 [Sparus aurata]|uniref:formin BNI1-like isoform X1 n=1 Tax=Sparus aurata TaxID=8175 RepID=UPI0011C11232|nr:formin BNI1-like isoform X1 [Sparus aurata]
MVNDLICLKRDPNQAHSHSPEEIESDQAASGNTWRPQSKDRDRWRGREKGGGGFKMPGRRTTSSNPVLPSAPPPPAPPPPPRPPLRSRRKSKSPSSRSNHPTPKRALDLDKIGVTTDPDDSRPTRRGSRDLRSSQGSDLDRKWEGVALELRCRGSRMRSAVYQNSDLPSMVKAKRQPEQSGGKGQIDRSKLKATFV